MATTIGKLTALKVARKLPPGMYADGAGLYLQVTGAGAKSWIYRFSLQGKAREMGLGSLSAVSLADARNKAAECRTLRQEGIDPIAAREARRAQAALEEAKAITFTRKPRSGISGLTARAGKTPSTPVSGKIPLRPTPTRLLGRFRCKRLTQP